MNKNKTKDNDGHDSQPRRSTRIREIEAKKEVELRNKENLVDNNMKCAHRSRSKSIASDRPQNRRTLVDVNSSKTPPNPSSNGGRRCNSRSQSTASDRNIEVSSNKPARRSLFGCSAASSSPKRYFMAKSARYSNYGRSYPDMPLPTNGTLKTPTKSADCPVDPSKSTSASPQQASGTLNARAKPGNRCVNRSQSMSASPQQALITLNAPSKSNLKSAHRTIRSKSVSFDRPLQTASPQALTSHGPIDLTVKTAAAHQPIALPNTVGTGLPNVSSPKPSDQLASDMQLAYENRIGNLVESNFAKINRIKELMAENRSWREQYDALNRINQSLVATVDAFNVQTDPSVTGAAVEKAKYEHEIEGLRDRINRLNRENFNLRSTNERLKSSLATHSTQVLGEHNYNM